jgi:hypothetical protein
MENQKPFIEKADRMILLNKKLLDEVNEFKDWLMLSFNIENLSQKLENYYKLPPNEFVGELKKKKVNIKSRTDFVSIMEGRNECLKVIIWFDG